ncbi:MAG: hypothetical protein QM756_28495 [Polyangiaceae bacterium]
MTLAFKQFELVRVVELVRRDEHRNGWKVNQRFPALGDVGTITDVVRAPGLAERYVVECSGADGVTIWLEDFDAQELEPA